MINPNATFFYTPVYYGPWFYNRYWNEVYENATEKGKDWIDMAQLLGQNCFVARTGHWEMPWKTKIIPNYAMPSLDKNFTKSFSDVTDARALEVKNIINTQNCRIAVYYSGGIDSLLTLIALMKNLDKNELKMLDVCLSAESIMENPRFYEKFIAGKLNCLDSATLRYDESEAKGAVSITSDVGDAIFGTEFGTHFYHCYDQFVDSIPSENRSSFRNIQFKVSDPDVHFSQYKDLLLKYFHIHRSPKFAERYYDQMVRNINSSGVPVNSLHDFFWWQIFNLKYLECALRSAVVYNSSQNLEHAINHSIFNWYNGTEYQLWAMNNNNNGQKISNGSISKYKTAARKYIYDFDKSDWYFKYKTKISSMQNIVVRNNSFFANRPFFGIDENYNRVYLDDPGSAEVVMNRLANY